MITGGAVHSDSTGEFLDSRAGALGSSCSGSPQQQASSSAAGMPASSAPPMQHEQGSAGPADAEHASPISPPIIAHDATLSPGLDWIASANARMRRVSRCMPGPQYTIPPIRWFG